MTQLNIKAGRIRETKSKIHALIIFIESHANVYAKWHLKTLCRIQYNLDYLLLQHCSLGPDLHTQLQSLMQAQLPPHLTVEHWQAKMVKFSWLAMI